MDERRRRAWAALELGPVWHRRQPVDSPGSDPPPDTGPTDREALIAALGWPELAREVAACTACALSAGRRNTVFGAGPASAPWLLVGEAPGEQEDLQGEPFVGPAGRLLDQMLASIGVDRRQEAFIANVLKCRPPGNRNPEPEEVALCTPFLRRQIALLQPRVIVALGRFAAQSLLGTQATIAALRGRLHPYPVGAHTVPLVVTYHPAYLLRNLPDKAKTWVDLRMARRAFEAQSMGSSAGDSGSGSGSTLADQGD